MYRPYSYTSNEFFVPANKIKVGDTLIRGNHRITEVAYNKLTTTLICKNYDNHTTKVYRLHNYEEIPVRVYEPKFTHSLREGMIWATDLRPGDRFTATGGGLMVMSVDVGQSAVTILLNDFSVRQYDTIMAVTIETKENSDEPDMGDYTLDKVTEISTGAYIILDAKQCDRLVQVSKTFHSAGFTFLYFTNGKYAKYHQSEMVKVVKF